MEQPNITYTRWGLANFFEDHIELNEALKEDKLLTDYVISHELTHTKGHDLDHEFDYSRPRILIRLLWFVIRHPRTWIDFLPIQYRKGNLIIDWNQIYQYLIIFSLLIGLYFIIRFIF